MKTSNNRRGLLREFWQYAHPYQRIIITALLVMLLDTLSGLAAPWPVKIIFDTVLLKKSLQSPWSHLIPGIIAQNRMLLFLVLCSLLFILAITSALATYYGMRMLTQTGQRVIFDLRCALFTHLQRLSPSFYDRQRLGDLLSRLTSDVQTIQDLLVLVLPMLILSIMIVIGMLGILLIINRVFFLLGVAISICIFFVLYKYLRSIKQVTRASASAERVLDLLNTEPDIIDQPHALVASPFHKASSRCSCTSFHLSIRHFSSTLLISAILDICYT